MDNLALWVGIVALVIALYSAHSSRRSAKAAEQSSTAANEAIALAREQLRQAWVSLLQDALPDPRAVTGLLGDLPSFLAPEWLQLVMAAADRNPRTPKPYLSELLEKHRHEWEAAAKRRRDE